ncbi:restriction endonuclease subunit S [Enterococcus rivorum]
MSKLEELIEELCPDGVEYKKVKDCFTRLKGTSITAGKMKEIENKNGEIKIFAGGKTVVNAKEEDIPNANITRVPAVLVQSRGVIDIVYFEKPFTFKNEMWAYTNDEQVTVKYLFYVLKNSIQIFRDSASGMGALPQISLKVTEDFVFPLPPLPVQAEIVRILDNFTELTAELTAELMARKKQYEYYRIYLFNSVKSVQMKTLDNIAENCDSERKPVKSGIREIGDIPYYGASGIIDHVQDYIYEGDYL